MQKNRCDKEIFLLDDEIFNATWMIDYIESLDYSVVTATSANEAFSKVSNQIYRVAILDLNVPIHPPLEAAALTRGTVYARFPGLFIAQQARQSGYRGRQVVLYSVHRDTEVTEEARKLGCTYILKGRPKEMMAELQEVLAYDPTEDV